MEYPTHDLVFVQVYDPWPTSQSVFDDIKDSYFGEIAPYIVAVAAISGAVLLIRAVGGR